MKLPITHRHRSLFKDAQYRQYDDGVTRYGSVIPQASLSPCWVVVPFVLTHLLVQLGNGYASMPAALILRVIHFTKANFRGSLIRIL